MGLDLEAARQEQRTIIDIVIAAEQNFAAYQNQDRLVGALREMAFIGIQEGITGYAKGRSLNPYEHAPSDFYYHSALQKSIREAMLRDQTIRELLPEPDRTALCDGLAHTIDAEYRNVVSGLSLSTAPSVQ